ncbi:MAG: hypothetical protein NTV94_04255 [Planctomycetota bacterium]|nr:hypothetical protein [Planctomycetota bacterium]
MLVLSPQRVMIDSTQIDDVHVLSVERAAERTLVHWSDEGPFATFADVPELRTIIRIEHSLHAARTESTLLPGRQALLKAGIASAPGSTAHTELSATIVVLSVTHDVASRKAPVRRIECLAIASNGSRDPIVLRPLP